MPLQRVTWEFIISPCDKGGKLYEPSTKLLELCRPLTPMAFNDLYCLRDPAVHPLHWSCPTIDFAEHVATVQALETHLPHVATIEQRLDQAMNDALGGIGCKTGIKAYRDKSIPRRNQYT